MNKFMKQCLERVKLRKKIIHKTFIKIANSGADKVRFTKEVQGVGSGNPRKRMWGLRKKK